MTEERRKHPRFDLEYTIQLISQAGDMVITALTSNLSDGGARMPMPSDCLPAVGSEVQINLTIRRNTTGEVEMYTGVGEVVRHCDSDADGMAQVAMKFHAPMDLKLSEGGAEATPDL